MHAICVHCVLCQLNLYAIVVFCFQTGDSRKKVVVEMKRGIVAANEAKFQSQVFQLTTDDDMPAYSGFEFAA